MSLVVMSGPVANDQIRNPWLIGPEKTSLGIGIFPMSQFMVEFETKNLKVCWRIKSLQSIFYDILSLTSN